MSDSDANATLARLKELLLLLEDLLKRIADTDDPNIRRARAKVHAKLIAVQSAMNGGDIPA
jgi:ElaB/YqjD/DUF883 family membrane-anchored ribosome-binding protein